MQRKFIPGSEWIYFKLYTGTKTADQLLAYNVSAFVKKLLDSEAIDRFFFIRYLDPHFHIRLRLHLPDLSRYSDVFSAFYAHFTESIDSGMIYRAGCDTYVREIERYGADTMLLSEEVFYVDSEAVLNLILYDESYMPRWHQAFLLVDDTIRAFISTNDARRDFTLQLANSYKREFGFESNLYTRQLNEKYRSLRPQIEKLMHRDGDFGDIYTILEKRKSEVVSLSAKIYDAIKGYESLTTLHNLLSSYIHMLINRLFRSKNRLNEMIVYDYLNRYYDSIVAREKYLVAGEIN